MDNKINIIEKFLFNEDLFHQVNKKQKRKKIKWTLGSLLIIVICVIGQILILSSNHVSKFLAIIGLGLIVIGCIFFFAFLYNIFSLTVFISSKAMVSNRCYALTNQNELISVKYGLSSFNLRYDILKDNVFDEIIKYLILQNSLKKDNQEMRETIESQKLLLDDLYECLNIVNVYEIKEKEDCIEIMCDYVDLIRNVSCKKQSLTIYKYFDNWEEILNKLKVQQNSLKKQLTQPDGSYGNFVDFIIKGSSRKSNGIFFHAFFIISFLNEGQSFEFVFVLEIGIVMLAIMLYAKKSVLKHLYKDVEYQREFMQKKVRNNIIFLIIYSLLFVFYTIIFFDKIFAILIGLVFITIVALLFIKKCIEK